MTSKLRKIKDLVSLMKRLSLEDKNDLVFVLLQTQKSSKRTLRKDVVIVSEEHQDVLDPDSDVQWTSSEFLGPLVLFDLFSINNKKRSKDLRNTLRRRSRKKINKRNATNVALWSILPNSFVIVDQLS